MKGALARAREALRSPDFRRLFLIRMLSQSADGMFQSTLVASVVFSPAQQNTAAGFAKATLLLVLPYSLIGPFTGVFIDRWPRRAILAVVPWLRAALVWLVLFDPDGGGVPFYAGALWILSINRFFLATAAAVVPRLVPGEDLLIANSAATVGGTVALLAGVTVGGQIADAFGSGPVVTAAGVMWIFASFVARRIESDLRALHAHTAPLGHELVRAAREYAREFADGARHLVRSPRALGPITSITLDQLGQGIMLVLSLAVFRDRFDEGIGAFARLVGVGGVGVFAGLLTVGKLEERLAKERIVAIGFAAGAIAIVGVALGVTRFTVLLASFAVGLTFAWKKVSVDTMVQEAVPDGYRGRVFAVYDVAYNVARVVSAGIVIPMIDAIGIEWSAAVVGIAFLLWAPVLPRWTGRVPELVVRFYAGATADEAPRAIVWGGAEEPVEVLRSWREERAGARLRCFRLRLLDDTTIDVSCPDGGDAWRLDRELSRD
ncbi:MAG TPA: MFS transporter [Actinomycetota bacterium]|nr:MFS transporter [Actinomycetota bacterium]